ncbi:hypothetical protein F4780DRAFT_473590 [Xylariomycetidae sp. FL0641]|nr:hypothetical protein F4780DRAFT_473590 [Xylariomycetidae sp. FL0641]
MIKVGAGTLHLSSVSPVFMRGRRAGSTRALQVPNRQPRTSRFPGLPCYIVPRTRFGLDHSDCAYCIQTHSCHLIKLAGGLSRPVTNLTGTGVDHRSEPTSSTIQESGPQWKTRCNLDINENEKPYLWMACEATIPFESLYHFGGQFGACRSTRSRSDHRSRRPPSVIVAESPPNVGSALLRTRGHRFSAFRCTFRVSFTCEEVCGRAFVHYY